ncbi:MAG: acetate--CoA ligase [Saprospiraceae bacterium]|nr:acetate--CoA ligase [Saprospiraceae bacterium]
MSNIIKSFGQYKKTYKRSVDDPEGFWAEQAERFVWRKKWDKVVDWDFHDYYAKWFSGGQVNITENALDRYLEKQGDKAAIIWEPNDPNDTGQTLTYRQLHAKVCQFANVLKNNGIEKGDRVCLYMPMIPELAIATLACARIGAIHSVVFGGFSAQALADRVIDAEAKVIVTADGVFRGNKELALKNIVDEAVAQTPSVTSVIVFKRVGNFVHWSEGRDKWWHEEMAKASTHCDPVAVDSEDPLFILYTSGSTGKPKGVVHTTGGYMVYTHYTFSQVFQVGKNDVYWCTADIGWITGHSYIVYGPLLAGATTVMFEGIPTWPDAGRFWEVIDKLKVNQFYTAPTAIRSLMGAGLQHVAPHSLSTLKVLGSVGEPINEEAWQWYHKYIGKSRCPIVDTWWQTETGGIMISPLPNVTPLKPTMATLPLPGVQPCLLTPEGKEIVGDNVEGLLCIKYPWPSMIRTTYGDHKRCQEVYFGPYKGYYFTGDGARRDEDGYYRIIGRVDDVINVSGHRIGTAEVEDAINKHPFVVESAVVGYPHDIKGQGIYAFVICDRHVASEKALKDEILVEITKQIGPIAKPDIIQVVPGLPKTRSGKIMRRILRKIAEGDVSNLGDISTLLDPGVVEIIKDGAPTLKK